MLHKLEGHPSLHSRNLWIAVIFPRNAQRGGVALVLLSSGEQSRDADICDSHASSSIRGHAGHPGPTRALGITSLRDAAFGTASLRREQRIREAVLLSFCDPVPDRFHQLLQLSNREWRRLLRWLDISGLALYFFDRLVALDLCSALPSPIVDRLQQNLIDNTIRTRGMIDESVAIQLEFQEAGLSYAMLKGFSLCPSSVPRPELRHQFDLDYLIAEESVQQACQILERRGYRLYAISGKSWEFKINETPSVSLKDLYKDLPGRAVELHVEVDMPGCTRRLGG